jgi:phenylacetate-CoA ligase
LDVERAEQRRWRLRPKWAHASTFDDLLCNEFRSVDELHARQSLALAGLVEFAAVHVPYYREMFLRLGISAGDIRQPEHLTQLPPLPKDVAQERRGDLCAVALPPGQEPGGVSRTSGTTGRPLAVEHTRRSKSMFAVLKQRELRWFRFDPSGILATIRPARELPHREGEGPPPDGTMWESPVWPLVGQCFETGRWFGFAHTNPIERQIEWLDRHRPHYLLAQSANLEHLALAYGGAVPPDSLRGLEAIAQQLTPAMRRSIEQTFRVPVQQNYGLNEIGIVASRCPEAGRYHVHAEHCLVEIVDEQGRPCRPGQLGKVLVTGLSNHAMPLLRYDADDLAEVADGPCPCGRTLPSFGRIVGRYRRTAFLPPGTWNHWTALQVALADMPDSLRRHLRQYQLHQYRDGRFQLRLVTACADARELIAWFQRVWEHAVAPSAPPLEIVQVRQIERGPSEKYQDFTSDFVPPRDDESSPVSLGGESTEQSALVPIEVTDRNLIDAICRFRVEVWSATGRLAPGAFPDGTWRDEWDDRCRHLVVMQGDRIVAAARWGVYRSLSEAPEADQYKEMQLELDGPIAVVERVVVSTAVSHLGLSVALLNAIQEKLRADGVKYEIGQVSPSMLRLMRRRGREILGPAAPDPRFPGLEFRLVLHRL